MMRKRFCVAILGVMLGLPALAFGAPYDAPTLQLLVTGIGKAVVQIQAGPSGAPAGFTFQWMLHSDYIANGGHFYPAPNSVQGEARFTGRPTLNTFRGAVTNFVLQPNQGIWVEIGDLFDESGVTVTAPSDELKADRTYVLAAYTNGGATGSPSPLSNVVSGTTRELGNCTVTQGFWKTHEEVWPVSSLTLGWVTYTKQQLVDILREPVRGNGLISLAHQLIAAKLNIANGAELESLSQFVLVADALIGDRLVPPVGTDTLDPSLTSSTTQIFDDYNNGLIGPGECTTTSVEEVSWGRLKAAYR